MFKSSMGIQEEDSVRRHHPGERLCCYLLWKYEKMMDVNSIWWHLDQNAENCSRQGDCGNVGELLEDTEPEETN